MEHELGTRLTSWLTQADHGREDWRETAWANRRQYENLYKTNRGRITHNKLFAAIQQIFSALRPDRVETRIVPWETTPRDVSRAQEAMLNSMLRESDAEEPASEMILDALVSGEAFGRVEWSGPFTKRVEDDSDGGERAVYGKPSDVGRPIERSRESAVEEAVTALYPHHLIGKDGPILWRYDPMDVLVDPAATNLKSARWIAVRFWLTMAEIERLQKAGFFEKMDVKYKAMLPSAKEIIEQRMMDKAKVSAAEGSAVASRGPSDDSAEDYVEQEADEPVEVWQLDWRSERRNVWVVPGVEEPLRNTADGLAIRRPRTVRLSFSKVPWKLWSPPDSIQYIETQRTLDNLLTFIVDSVRKNSKRLILADRSEAKSTTDIESIATAGNATVVPCDNPEAFKVFESGGVDQSAVQLVGILERIVTEVSGVSRTASGVPTNPAVSATEVRATTEAFSNRMRRMQLDVNRMLREVASLYLDLAQELLSGERAVKILGANSVRWEEATVVKVGRKDIEGEYDLSILVGAAAEQDEAMARKLLLDAYNFLAASPTFLDPMARRRLDEELMRHSKLDYRTILGQAAPPPPPAVQPGVPVGRSPEEGPLPVADGAAEAGKVSPDEFRRSGRPEVQSLLTDAIRGGGR